MLHKLNFTRVLDNFKFGLNLWKGRSLTILGRAEIVRTLAIPKILYVCNYLDPPSSFLKEVKSSIVSFIWSKKRPKVKYSALINNYNEGGIKVPDIGAKLKAQKIMWVKRVILDTGNTLWIRCLESLLESVGGRNAIRSNFKKELIPPTLPLFYKQCFKTWCGFVDFEPTKSSEIMIQPLWNNSKIPVKLNRRLFAHGISSIKSIINENDTLKKLNEIITQNDEMYNSLYLPYLSLTKSVPKRWLHILQNSAEEQSLVPHSSKEYVSTKHGIISISLLTSKCVYDQFLYDIIEDATAKVKYEHSSDNSLEWRDVCKNIYKTTICTYTRQFQYRIIHNYLHVNYTLYKWKLIDSPRCSYCFLTSETEEHLFVDCPVAITLYCQIREWCRTMSLELPDRNKSTIMYGVPPDNIQNILINHILLLYKMILFSSRENSRPSLSMFIVKIKEIETIERNIARNKNKLDFHFTKWAKIIKTF